MDQPQWKTWILFFLTFVGGFFRDVTFFWTLGIAGKKGLEAQQGWNPKATHLSDEFVTSFAPFSGGQVYWEMSMDTILILPWRFNLVPKRMLVVFRWGESIIRHAQRMVGKRIGGLHGVWDHFLGRLLIGGRIYSESIQISSLMDFFPVSLTAYIFPNDSF